MLDASINFLEVSTLPSSPPRIEYTMLLTMLSNGSTASQICDQDMVSLLLQSSEKCEVHRPDHWSVSPLYIHTIPPSLSGAGDLALTTLSERFDAQRPITNFNGTTR